MCPVAVPANAAWNYLLYRQLNDILDALLEVVPEDVCAIMLAVSHIIYEGKVDDSCAGRVWLDAMFT